MNLRQLLALPPVLAIGWVLYQGPIYDYTWKFDLSHVSCLDAEINFFAANDPQITVGAVQQWVEGKELLVKNRPSKRIPNYSIDSWGNRYQVVEHPSSTDDRRFGVYSLGKDGITRTNGNDEDDISSWSKDPLRHYSHAAQLSTLPYHVGFAILFAFVVYPLVFYLLRTQDKEGLDYLE